MLKAENLSLYVDDEGEEKCLLNDISFQVDDGEMLLLQVQTEVESPL